MRFRTRFFGKAVLVLAAAAILSGIVMLLWNAVIPALFVGAHAIDYLHAVGLLVLSRILFGGFRGHGGWRGRHHWGRWQAMTPEEREQFRQNMSGRCGGAKQA
jgi:hypothetical protein